MKEKLKRKFTGWFVVTLLMAVAWSAMPAAAQTAQRSTARVFGATGSSPKLALVGSGVAYNQICWNLYGGTLTTSSVKMEKAADGATWTDLGTANTVTANGCGPVVAGSNNYVRITITTFTADAGAPRLNVSYTGWRLPPTPLGFVTDVILCGQQANAGTIYMSPITGFAAGNFYTGALTANDLSYIIGGTGCDAEDNATEGSADEPLFTNNAVKVLGMVCKVSSSGANGVVLNLRSAEGSLTPNITITIPTATTTGATATGTTTDIAAGATFALRVINTEDLSAEDAWCIAKILVVP
jgi:hypothetical protein